MDVQSATKVATPASQTSGLQPNRRSTPTESRLVCHPPGSPQRRIVEEFVRSEFLLHFDARIKHFMPVLVGLHDGRGRLRAVVGCRNAAAEPLFLETYTRDPIEKLLAQRLDVRVPREQIVEIGSLACRGGRAAIDIVKALIPFLLQAGFSWVVFTGADTVMNVFRYLKLAPHVLCVADQALLGEARHDWGTYYDHHPHVMTGRILEGIDALTATPRLQ